MGEEREKEVVEEKEGNAKESTRKTLLLPCAGEAIGGEKTVEAAAAVAVATPQSRLEVWQEKVLAMENGGQVMFLYAAEAAFLRFLQPLQRSYPQLLPGRQQRSQL